MTKHVCFIISPIGEKDSEIRQNADDLLELIIKPALEVYQGIEVVRGDHRNESNQIDDDVIKSVQEADLCICDLSEPNVNVYYELGRRDETGKPIILVKRKGSIGLPVDIATRRFIEYDLDSRYGVRDAITQIRSFVDPIAEHGFTGSAGSSLVEIATMLQRVERKIDRISQPGNTIGTVGGNSGTILPPQQASDTGLEPMQELKLGIKTKNIAMMEHAMSMLQYQMDKISFLDRVVEAVASRGSEIAGNLMIDNLQEFMDSPDTDYKMKLDYLGTLVSYANRKDLEATLYQTLEDNVFPLLLANTDDQVPQNIAQVYNQKNRLYYGLYANTQNEQYLEMAIGALKDALRFSEESYLYYNLATCERNIDIQLAKEHIEKCINMEANNPDEDHLVLAMKIYKQLDDPNFTEMVDRLKEVNPQRAQYELLMMSSK